MDLAQAIAELSRSAGAVEVQQTHISVVFLTERYAYKLKKPVRLDFLDFSTPERRRHFCEEEVRLNRRLAPHVYLGVVPVVRTAAGLAFEGAGAAVDWAVKMERLPAEATLQRRLQRGEVSAAAVEELARRVAAFHAAAEGGPHVAAFGSFEAVARNVRENLERAKAGPALSAAVLSRLRRLTDEALERLRPLIAARTQRGVPRDTHGDLHLDHVYLFPDRPPPEDLVIIDCIEFSERFRFADPVADMAFLVMDFAYHDHRAVARRFAEAYFRASGDVEGRALLPLYTSYRAAVRGKVEGIKLAEAEVPPAEKTAALASARAHWLLALDALEAPERRPCLVLVAGLPGSGKSTLARHLGESAGLTVLRSDVVRKELAGDSPQEDIYAPEWSERTYAECLRRAEAILLEGGRVLVDANFRQERQRRTFLQAAVSWGVRAGFLQCRANPEVVRARLAGRQGDASDADWEVYLQARGTWEEAGPLTQRFLYLIDSGGEQEQTLGQALDCMRQAGLFNENEPEA
jgi:aminoglycoside phosphotransferase family enzyme/predicted kinase